MTPLDYCIIALYFGIIIAIGAAFSKSQKSLKDYFLGSRNMPWWAAMLSGIATIVSAISYLGAPGVAFASDYTLQQYRLGMPVTMLILGLFMLPYFYNNQRYSIYTYFEDRFDLKTRLFTSALFILLKIGYLGIAIYAPALVIKEMFGLPIWQVVTFVGAFTIAYTILGGIKAVIWTDCTQLAILLFGLFLVAYIATSKTAGGLEAVIELGQAEDKFRFFNFSWSLTEKYTFLGGLVGGGFFLLTIYGTDQAELQRFLTTRTLRESNLALMSTLVFTFLFSLFVFFIGTTLFAFYSQNPDKGAMGIPSSQVMPKFIIEELPGGVKGLLVASILSAAMSTVSSVLNSVTTVGISDFYNRFARDEASVRFARLATLGIGLIGMALASLMGRLGNILETGMTLNSFFGGPLVGAFLLGMLSRRARPTAAFVGLCFGFAFAIYLGFFTAISFLWYGLFSALATALCGYLLSLAFPPRSSPARPA